MSLTWPDAMTAAESEAARLDAREQKILGFVGMLAAVVIGLGLYLIWS